MTTCMEDILEAGDEATVCYCNQVNKKELVSLIRQGNTDLGALKRLIGADGNRCAELSPRGRCCTPEIVRLLRHEKGMLPMA
ncbi:(2Fe-2S)-binding protein [Desulfovibrio mangrovi]|uniref:(2Fe-2S)-binding protein n=1 Tax=Desulfovibrio mangrovi TaxID=2976983 RepID=UPI00224526E6|nr:(2Fe-2S)-binding protein [Desulfovibrio mangrovi]UZP68674.1 (2Fe-2S)-binding protein [Desulfovibrio mangrovi]